MTIPLRYIKGIVVGFLLILVILYVVQFEKEQARKAADLELRVRFHQERVAELEQQIKLLQSQSKIQNHYCNDVRNLTEDIALRKELMSMTPDLAAVPVLEWAAFNRLREDCRRKYAKTTQQIRRIHRP